MRSHDRSRSTAPDSRENVERAPRPGGLLGMQARVGNQAVLAMLRAEHEATDQQPTTQQPAARRPTVRHSTVQRAATVQRAGTEQPATTEEPAAGAAEPVTEPAPGVKELIAELSRSIAKGAIQDKNKRNIFAPGTWWPEQWMVQGPARLRKALDRRVMRGEVFGEDDLKKIKSLSTSAPKWLRAVGIGTYEEAEKYTAGRFDDWLKLPAGKRLLTASVAYENNLPSKRGAQALTPTDPAYTLGRFMITQGKNTEPDTRAELKRERDQQIRDTALDTLHPDGMADARRHRDAAPKADSATGKKDSEAREMLTRILLVLRHGLQLYDAKEKKHVVDHEKDIIRALAHGGRVNVRIPALSSKDEAAYWLPHFLGATRSATEGEVAENVSKRGFATHRTSIGANKDGEEGAFKEKGGGLAAITNAVSVGASRPKLWGRDISGGGLGSKDWNGDMVLPNGSYGHILLVYHRPTMEKDGSLQIGIETIAPHARSPVGYTHDFRSTEATANPESVLHGHKGDKIGSGGTGKNERLVDLRAMGASHESGDWRVFLKEIQQDWERDLEAATTVSAKRRAYEQLIGPRPRPQ